MAFGGKGKADVETGRENGGARVEDGEGSETGRGRRERDGAGEYEMTEVERRDGT
jgi:hypothetical protein